MNIDVPKALLEKHNKAGPRYTSYPTVPAWRDGFTADDYHEALVELNDRPDEDLSLYLHLPFCAKHCHYCGCNALVSTGKDAVTTYLDRVERELDIVCGTIGTKHRVAMLHWGGGTPNYLKNPELERALNLFRDRFDIQDGAEISIEVDPRIGTPEQARFLRGLGFNRISLGLQDFEADVQKAIGRKQSRDRTMRLYHGCRDAGFEGVNVDLVYGLPYQTPESFARTITDVIAVEPDRVACFSYAHVPWVKPAQEKVDTRRMPDGFEKFGLFRMAIDLFEEAGYDWIGIDHFAKRDDELSIALRERRLHRNFMGYTTRPASNMLAFGMSGIGEVCDRFIQNDANLPGYYEAVDAGRLPIVRGHKLNRDDRLRRMAILNLMCNLELPYALTTPGFGAPADELLAEGLKAMRIYEDEGFVEFKSDRVVITDLGRFFVRNVCMELDAYLDDKSDKPLFSKTI